jgi:hypothetical protein
VTTPSRCLLTRHTDLARVMEDKDPMTRNLWRNGVHMLQHTGMVICGIVLIVLGMAMTFSLIFVVPGLFVLAIGVAVVVGAIFAHETAGP